MEQFFPYLGVLFQWARSRPKFGEETYLVALALSSFLLYAWATPAITAQDWRTSLTGAFQLLLTIAGTTQLTSSGSNVAKKVFDARWAPVTNVPAEGATVGPKLPPASGT